MAKKFKFHISDPKPREVSSLIFRDRVVHKLICKKHGFYDQMFKDSFYCNCACQVGKGTQFARELLKKYLRSHYNKFNLNGYVLNLDISKFFMSIPHDKLIENVNKKVKDEYIKSLVIEIIKSSSDTGVGLDLGSEINQILANSYLTDVDFLIKQHLRIKEYVRYADNMVIILPENSKENANKIKNIIESKLSELGLKLNPKSAVFPLKQGIDFLGFRFRLTDTGRINTNIIFSKLKRRVDTP